MVGHECLKKPIGINIAGYYLWIHQVYAVTFFLLYTYTSMLLCTSEQMSCCSGRNSQGTSPPLNVDHIIYSGFGILHIRMSI